MPTPLKPEEILQLLQLPPEVNSLDELRQQFETKYAPLESLTDPKSPHHQKLAPQFVGKVTGSATTALRRKLKALGVELSEDELKDKKIEEVLETGLDKLHGTLAGKVSTLEADLAKTRDEATRELSEKLQKQTSRLQEVETLLKNTAATHESEKAAWQQQLRGVRVEGLRKAKADQAIKWRPDLKETERVGFWAIFDQRYKTDLAETGDALELLDAEGKRVPSKAKVGSFLTYEEALEQTARELGVWNENPAGGQARPGAARFAVPGAAVPGQAAPAPGPGGRPRVLGLRPTNR